MKETKIYTREQLDELIAWFGPQELPPSLQIDSATFVPDLKKTLGYLFGQAELCYENPKMQGCIRLLEKIKAHLENRNRS